MENGKSRVPAVVIAQHQTTGFSIYHFPFEIVHFEYNAGALDPVDSARGTDTSGK